MATKPETLYRIRKIKKYIEIIAYGSLILDFSITAVTLFSINTGGKSLYSIQQLLNYALSGVMVITVLLFVLILLLSHYENILYQLAQMGIKAKRKRRRRTRLHAF